MLKRFHPLRVGDIILIIIVVLLSLGGLFAIPIVLGETSGEGKEIVVNLDGQEIHRFTMDQSDEVQFIEFPLEVRGIIYTGVLEVQDGAVRLQRLPHEISPLSIHADKGWIREPHQMIVSLPARLYISLENTAEDASLPEIDAVAY